MTVRVASLCAVLAIGVALRAGAQEPTSGAGVEPAAASTGVPGDPPAVGAARDGTGEPAAGEKKAPEKKAALRLGIASNEAPVNITSDKLEMLPAPGGGDLIRFRGGVRLDQGDLALRCDGLDAYYAEGQTGRPQKIVATGAVRVRQLGMRLSCQRATFVDDECIAVCESNLACDSKDWPSEPAVLQRETNTVSGRLLEFDLCTGELTAPCGAQVQLRDKEEPPAIQAVSRRGAAGGAPQAAEGAEPAGGTGAPAKRTEADDPAGAEIGTSRALPVKRPDPDGGARP